MTTQVPFRIRQDVFHRCDWACFYCGQRALDDPQAGWVGLCIDHVMPKALDGGNEATNLVACCHTCNNLKGARAPHPLTLQLVAVLHQLWVANGRPASTVSLARIGEDHLVYEMFPREAKAAAVSLHLEVPL